jgi:ribosome-associated protein
MHSIVVSETVTVPAEAITMTATHSSGPGGDNVTGVASKVHVHVDIDKIIGLRESEGARLRELAGKRLDADGRIQVTSQKTPDQHQNLEDALRKVRELVLAATVHRAERLGTTHTVAAVQKRIDEKKAVAHIKDERSEDFSDEVNDALSR